MICERCGSKTANKKYCSRSCAVSVNNVKSPKRVKEGTCRECDETIPKQRTYCDVCFANRRQINAEHAIKKWLNGEWRGGSDKKVSEIVRRYLIDESHEACSKCGYDTPHPDDGSSILEINHIDGDGTNHTPDNLEVVCPNCHALTSTYRARNIGNATRPFHYVRKSRQA